MARCGCIRGGGGGTGPTGPAGPSGPAGATGATGPGGGGGGSCTQKTFYTVATPSSSLLVGFGLDTPEPFFSCADFVGDGIDDGAAIQAAIDAASSVGAPAGVPAYPTVFLLPGAFIFDGGTAPDPKGVPIQGAGSNITGILSLTGSQRAFNIIGGQNNQFTDFAIGNTGGAAIYHPGIGSTVLTRMAIAVADTGADVAAVDQPFGNLHADDCQFSAVNEARPVDSIRTASLSSIVNCHFLEAGIFLDGTTGAVSATRIQNNTFGGIHTAGSFPQDWVIGLISPGGGNNLIQGNHLHSSGRHGILLDGTGGGTFENLVQNNFIDRYDAFGTGSYDGIHLRNNADENNVQGNTVRDPSGNGNVGINIATADCTANYVVNNDAFNAGFNDSGTGTVTVSANRV